MAYLDIHSALTQSVIDLGLGLPIAHENTEFDPEKNGGDAFISISILYAEQNTVTKTGLDDVAGFLQISYYEDVKSADGLLGTYTVVDAINDFYKHDRKFTSNNQVVNIQNIEVTKRGNVNGWFSTDVTINFWSDLTR